MQGGGTAYHQAAHLLSSLPCGVVWKNDIGAEATLARSLSCMLTPARMPPYANENALACTQATVRGVRPSAFSDASLTEQMLDRPLTQYRASFPDKHGSKPQHAWHIS